jgi:hypothetical protein
MAYNADSAYSQSALRSERVGGAARIMLTFLCINRTPPPSPPLIRVPERR